MDDIHHDEQQCDRCGVMQKDRPEDLIWLTADGFTPREGEVVPPEAFKKYHALCEPCYYDVIDNT